MIPERQLTVAVPSAPAVSAILSVPGTPRACYVLAHGAGAGMRHPFLEGVAHGLVERGIATLRYQFPYMEQGRRRPDPPHLAQATVRAAVAGAGRELPGVALVAGGKSFGGRMTSEAQARDALPGVRGLAFLGFPLHAPGSPGVKRAAHLATIRLPMLFLQGTRDTLANLDLMRQVCGPLGARATLHIVEGGDHSFKVLKRSGRTDDEVRNELVQAIDDWITGIV